MPPKRACGAHPPWLAKRNRRAISLAMTDTLPMSHPALTLTRATVRFGARTALAEVSLQLTEQRIGIIGRNGSGKTTLLRLLAGLIAPSSGTVRLGAVDPFTDRKAVPAILGILFQNPDHQILFPTVIEELGFGLRQMGQSAAEAAKNARALLAAEGRAHWADRPCHHLSQGQRHYLCLLSILLMKPQTILLDEPFAGLDLASQIRLSRKFAGLPQRLITISHDAAAVADCTRIIWIDAGKVRADGPAAQVLAAYQNEMQQVGASDADTDISD
jgi:biotin transport system ATP-binding protein